MTERDPYAYWNAALAWRADPKSNPMPDFDAARPETGFYRGQHNEAVAIWWQGETCLAQVHRPNRSRGGMAAQPLKRGADTIGDSIFAYCCRHPVPYEIYQTFTQTGQWPEDVGPLAGPPKEVRGLSTKKPTLVPNGKNGFVPPNQGGNENGPRTNENESGPVEHIIKNNVLAMPEEQFRTEITDLIASAEEWLDSIGRKITEQVHADKLANYAVTAQAIEKRAEAAHAEEKRPFLEGGKAVDARWNPVLSRAEKIKRNLKTMLTPWLTEQARKATQEAMEAQKAKEAATLAGELPPAPSEPPSRSVAGTRGRVSLRTRKVVKIDDLRTAAEFIAKINNPPPAFVDGVRAAAELLIKAGVEVPGTSVKVEEYSA